MIQKTTKVQTLHLNQITADFGWNGRHEARARLMGPHIDSFESDGDSESPGIEGLATSMATVGQDSPVDVCIPVDGPHKGKMFLAAGFRRYAAVEYLQAQNPPASVKTLEPGQIVACVREGLCETEIRDLNNRENVRANLPVADYAYAVGERMKMLPKVSNNEIAAAMGKSSSYVSTLGTLYTGLKPKIFAAWRASVTRPVSCAVMLSIAKSPKSEQEELYAEALEAMKPRAAAGDKGAMKWVDTAVKNATLLGRQLGVLTRLGVIKGFDDEKSKGNIDDNIRAVVKLKDRYTVILPDGTKQKKAVSVTTDRRIVKALRAGFGDGLEVPEVNEEETEEADED